MTVSYLFRSDNTSEKVLPANGETFSIEELQEMVGGYFEYVPVPNKPSMRLVVNEDGLIKDLPINPMASGVYGAVIVGDALYTPMKMLG
jgi:hypothetical protein